jgi:signal transduction histidine kinase
MNKPLRVVLIEDDEADAELVLAELRRGGHAPTAVRVTTCDALVTALDDGPWDVVLSDYTLRSFSGADALEVLKKRALDIPFVIVSGPATEDLAVQAMKAGAHDCVHKDRLSRLNPVVERELREAAGRVAQRKLEEKLLLADRMASIGALVAGVAHEINNPLAIVLANLDLLSLLSNLPRGQAPPLDAPEVIETLRDAREATERVRVIVTGLKTLSRSNEEERRAIDVHKTLDFSIKMAWNEIRHRARLTRAYQDVPAVFGNEGRLGQLFLNLLINAAQAIPEGHAGDHEIRVVTRSNGDDSVIIEVHDSGLGIPAAVLGRIFDPFFTSKPVGVGTGLGLAICDTIVRSHGGEITAESLLGRGSKFMVRLPAAVPAPASASFPPPPSSGPGAASPPRRGKVLVVDDEPAIGSTLRRILDEDHDVEVTLSARAALALLDDGRRFDVILCDVTMPEQSGADLHAELLRRMPEQAERMVFLTGGAFTPRARAFLEQVSNRCVEKPFESVALRALCARMVH